MGSLGWPEILAILVVALIVFGPRKLPDLGKTLGETLAQFRKASDEFKRTWESEVDLEKRRIETPRYNSTPEPEPVRYESPSSSESSPESPQETPIVPTAPMAEIPGTIATSGLVEPVTAHAATETKRDWM